MNEPIAVENGEPIKVGLFLLVFIAFGLAAGVLLGPLSVVAP